jgi:hypothetical protein
MTEEVQNESIPEDEIHVSIVSIGGMDVSLKGKDVLVKFNLNFPSQAPHEGKTNVIYLSERTSFSSSFSSSMLYRFKVQRSRGTQKLFELKKAVFEVWRPGGLLKNPEMIARGYQALVRQHVLIDKKKMIEIYTNSYIL